MRNQIICGDLTNNNLNELSLFTGIGGGLLGTRLLGWKCIGGVEWNEYCCKVLRQRQKDGCLDEFPIWNMDIREFNQRIAEYYQGKVDVVTAGFPCQPFSVAGKKLAERDNRNMFPETKRTISIIKPTIIFLENVPGLLAHEYTITIFNELSEIGYKMLPPLKVGTHDTQAEVTRTRIWFVGFDNGHNDNALQFQETPRIKYELRGAAKRTNLQNVETSWLVANNYGVREIDDVSDWLEPIKALGNAQVPIVVKRVWELLTEPLHS